MEAKAEIFIAFHPLCADFVDIPDTAKLDWYLPEHLDLISRNIAAHVLIVLIVAVHYAVKQGDKGSVKTLLDSLTPEERSQLLFKQDREGNTVLHLAAREGHTETMKIVLDNITPEQHLQLRSIQNKDGSTAYQEAVRRYGTSDIIIKTLEQYQIEADYGVNYRKFAA